MSNEKQNGNGKPQNQLAAPKKELPPALVEPFTIGRVFANSGFFDDAHSAAQAITKVLAGKELGIPPLAAMTGIFLVQGRVQLSSTTMAGLIKRSGKYDYKIKQHTDKICEIEFFENSKSVGISTFSIDEAKAAGLIRPSSNWAKYPRNMLFARALSNGFKWFCPDLAFAPVFTEGDEPAKEMPTLEPEQPPVSQVLEQKIAEKQNATDAEYVSVSEVKQKTATAIGGLEPEPAETETTTEQTADALIENSDDNVAVPGVDAKEAAEMFDKMPNKKKSKKKRPKIEIVRKPTENQKNPENTGFADDVNPEDIPF